MKYFPYPDNRGQTHYEDCYRERRHHNCAVAEVDRLIAEVSKLRDALQEVVHATSEDNELLPLHYKQVQDIARKALDLVSTQQCQHSWHLLLTRKNR